MTAEDENKQLAAMIDELKEEVALLERRMKDSRSRLTRISADLLRGSFLPSGIAEDYPQKTYSAGRVAGMMEKAHAKLREIAIDLSNISRGALNGKTSGCQPGSVEVCERLLPRQHIESNHHRTWADKRKIRADN